MSLDEARQIVRAHQPFNVYYNRISGWSLTQGGSVLDEADNRQLAAAIEVLLNEDTPRGIK